MTQYRRRVVEAFVQLVVDGMIPAESAAECLHPAGFAPDLDMAEVTRLVADAAGWQVDRDRLIADPSIVWEYAPPSLADSVADLWAGTHAERVMADEYANRLDAKREVAIDTLAAEPALSVAS